MPRCSTTPVRRGRLMMGQRLCCARRAAGAGMESKGPLFALVDIDALRQPSREVTDRLYGLLDDVAEDYTMRAEIDRPRGR